MKRWTRPLRFRRAALFTAVLGAPALFLVWQAVWNPAIEFLVPSRHAEWALHPDQRVLRMRGTPVSDDVVFQREFQAPILPRDFVLEYRAFTRAKVELNGKSLTTEAPARWKSIVRIDLGPHLRPGENTLALRVHNPGAVPALLVASPAGLKTPGGWRAALDGGDGASRPVVTPSRTAPVFYEIYQPRPNPVAEWIGRPWYAGLVRIWLAALIGVGVWSFLRQPTGAAPGLEESADGNGPVRSSKGVISAAVLVISLGLHLWNAANYPYGRSYLDWKDHAEYVEKMAKDWRVPTARDGFQMYQPPGYYWCAGAVYRLAGGDEGQDAARKAVQYLGAVAGWALVLVTWLLARRFFEDEASRVVATSLAACLPMLLYTSPMISNETFAGLLIALAFYAASRIGERVSLRRAALVGALCGAALLSKYTAVFTVAAAGTFLAFRSLRSSGGGARIAWRPLAAFLAPVVVLSGWLYLRNAVAFGDPFVGNWDEQSGFHYEQDPGYRTLGFYLGFGRLFTQPTQHAPWLSFADGMYGTMWAEASQSFLNPGDDRVQLWAVVALLLAVWPTVLMLMGFAETLRLALQRPFADANFLLIAVPIWSVSALLAFTLEVPFYSTVKAFFLLSLVPILGIYLARGRRILSARSAPLRVTGDAVLAALALLNLVLYHYPAP